MKSCKHTVKLFSACVVLFGALGRVAAEAAARSTIGQSNSSKQLDYVLSKYLSNAELEEHMREFTSRAGCSQISQMFSIGRSANGTKLWGLEISNNSGMKEPKPNFKYVGNLHGDEPTGRVLILGLAEWLCVNWQTNERARRIVEDVHLYLLPSANPDGFAARFRTNRNGVDLNRNFPDPIANGNSLEATGSEQPETRALMDWIESRHYVASASMHEGALVANYPWDGQVQGLNTPNITQDDETFRHLAHSYADVNPSMHSSSNAEFPSGITNGAAWYPLIGGMQDWNYIVGKCMELTLELSIQKYPPEVRLQSIWEDNLDSLLNFPLTAVFGGLRGFTMSSMSDSHEGLPVSANITVLHSDWNITSDPSFGNFYRPLSPGKHTILVHAEEHEPQTRTVIIPQDNLGYVMNITLLKVRAKGKGRGLETTSLHIGSSKKSLPRKFGNTDMTAAQAEFAEGEELLISQEMWISMMQMAMYLLLGVVIAAFATVCLVAFRRRMAHSRVHQRS